MTVEVQNDCAGDRQILAYVHVRSQAYLPHGGIRHGILQFLLVGDLPGIDDPVSREGHILCDGGGVIPRCAVSGAPAVKAVAGFGRVVGLSGCFAGGQNLLGVVGVAVLVGHGETGDRSLESIQLAVKETPIGMVNIVTKCHQVSEDGDTGKTVEAGDRRILGCFHHTVYLAAVGVHGGIIYKIDTVYGAGFDYTACHGECTTVTEVYAAEERIPRCIYEDS